MTNNNEGDNECKCMNLNEGLGNVCENVNESEIRMSVECDGT